MSAPVVVAQPTTAYATVPQGQQEVGRWAIDVCEVGNCCTCLYAWCCSCCAAGSIKQGLDGTHFCIGCCCYGTSALRFLTRTAYNIEGNAHWDCWTGTFCPCCSLNQMLQTVSQKGRAPVPQTGPEFNLNERVACQQRSGVDIAYDVLYALLCTGCADGLILQTAGVPWWFGCICFNGFSASNTLRYHNRTKPCWNNEMLVDCCIPAVCVAGNQFTYGASGAAGGIIYTLGNLIEENHRHNRKCGYGLDFISVITGCIHWCTTCTCDQEEGRYLVKSTPVVY